MTGPVVPFTSGDLRAVADTVDEITAVVGDEILSDGDWRWGLHVDVTSPDGIPAGTLKPHPDGWLGFYPLEVTE